MRKIILTALCCCALSSVFASTAFAQELIVGGQAVGIQISLDGVMVAGVAAVQTPDGERSPAADAGIKEGDFITAVGGREVESAAAFIEAVGALGGECADVTVLRGDDAVHIPVQPVKSADGRWLMGIWLRDSISGIGTVTFCDPETGTFGALGHSVSDGEAGCRMPIREGSITDAEIVSVVPGASGTPGELNGCADMNTVKGSIEHNTENGIYGKALVRLGSRVLETGDIMPGKASIVCTVKGRCEQEYSVDINRVYRDADGTHVMLTVTDRELLACTGGIVQGMSGSPIIQNEKIVGAVTHVFVNQPQKGYGISIQDMLCAAEAEELAA